MSRYEKQSKIVEARINGIENSRDRSSDLKRISLISNEISPRGYETWVDCPSSIASEFELGQTVQLEVLAGTLAPGKPDYFNQYPLTILRHLNPKSAEPVDSEEEPDEEGDSAGEPEPDLYVPQTRYEVGALIGNAGHKASRLIGSWMFSHQGELPTYEDLVAMAKSTEKLTLLIMAGSKALEGSNDENAAVSEESGGGSG